jgi:hypothetical protein
VIGKRRVLDLIFFGVPPRFSVGDLQNEFDGIVKT